MARGDQLARQWKIIQTLLSSRRGRTATELAEALGCHSRTIYRDLEALQVAGFPIYTDRVEGKSHWSLLETAKHNIPIPFNLAELMALYFSRGMMKILKNTVFYDSLRSLFDKIKATLPPEYIQYLERIETSLAVGSKPYKTYRKIRGIIDQITEAAVQKKVIEIVYFSMSRKKETRRKVAPYKIWFFDGSFYLVGNCRLREDIRIFALDRIKHLEPTDESFVVPEDFDVDEFMQSSFGVFQGESVNVKIWFSSDVAGYIRERIWHESQRIHPQDDGSIIFEAEVAGTDEIKYWTMSWGSKALALSPESLRQQIQVEADILLKNYKRACFEN
ncbi:MAG: transcriptional regulator [Desulfobacteraceae bacterium]|jgi:predicted DNA-binding transcriptional regulator YafY